MVARIVQVARTGVVSAEMVEIARRCGSEICIERSFLAFRSIGEVAAPRRNRSCPPAAVTAAATCKAQRTAAKREQLLLPWQMAKEALPGVVSDTCSTDRSPRSTAFPFSALDFHELSSEEPASSRAASTSSVVCESPAVWVGGEFAGPYMMCPASFAPRMDHCQAQDTSSSSAALPFSVVHDTEAVWAGGAFAAGSYMMCPTSFAPMMDHWQAQDICQARDAADASVPPPPAHPPVLSSMKNADHEQGLCTPCIYFAHGVCQVGAACGFCHEPHSSLRWKRPRPPKHVRALLKERTAARPTVA